MPISVVVIEGNIAAGKSTFIDRVCAALTRRGIIAIGVVEPVDAWRAVGSEHVDMLSASYASPRENAFPFQITALLTHTRAVRCVIERARKMSATRNVIVLVERWPCSYRNVFVREAQTRKLFTKEQSAAYELVYTELCSDNVIDPSLVLLLEADAKLCSVRCEQRARDGEKSIDVPHLARLDALYKDLFAAPEQHFSPSTRIERIDVKRDLDCLHKSDKVAERWANQVLLWL